MNEKELLYKIALTKVKGVGEKGIKNLIAYTGSPEAVFKETKRNLLKIPGFGANNVKMLKSSDALKLAEDEIKFISKNGIETFFYLDDNYPLLLKECVDSPVMLYHKGNTDFCNKLLISIVGTRKVTRYGSEKCKQFISDLKIYNPVIVSGLAYGVDVISHKEALESGLNTLAVVAHGLDMIYPQRHRSVASGIVKNGGIITEYGFGTELHPSNFVQRNRIIAGISVATIVIESGVKGGALITADLANSYNRDVFALPGRISDKRSMGCNRLIKTNRAALIESVDDLVYILGLDANKSDSQKQLRLFPEFTTDEQSVVDLLAKDIGTFDTILKNTDFSSGRLAAILLELEFKGAVNCLPGKVYKLSMTC